MFCREIGLSGEIVQSASEKRITEAEKLGFEAIFIAKHNKFNLKPKNIQIHLISKIEDLLDFF